MENELYHHGVKGQKWGVRRYQNSDGSLTDNGKKRVAEYEAGKAFAKSYGDKKVKDVLRDKQIIESGMIAAQTHQQMTINQMHQQMTINQIHTPMIF